MRKVLLILALLCAMPLLAAPPKPLPRAFDHVKLDDQGGLIVVFQNGGSTVGTFPAYLTINCSTNLTCTASGTTITMVSTNTASTAFSALTTSDNTICAPCRIGTGGTLSTTGTGVINATQLLGSTWAIPGTIGSTTPNTGAFSTVALTGQLTSTLATGTAPFSVASTTPVANLSIGGNAATATSATSATNSLGLTFGVTSIPLSATAPTANQCLAADGTASSIIGTTCGAGGSITLQTNGVANGSNSTLNFVTSATNSTGLSATPSNINTNQEKIEVGGTLNLASLTAPATAGDVVCGNSTPLWADCVPGVSGRTTSTSPATWGQSDRLSILGVNFASAGTVNITSPVTLGNNWASTVYNSATSASDTAALTPGAGTINGLSVWSLPAGMWGTCNSPDNTNLTCRFSPGELFAGSGITLTPDSSGYGTDIAATAGTPSFPLTVGGTVNSGGIPCFTSITQESSSSALTANAPVLGGGAGVCPSSETNVIVLGAGANQMSANMASNTTLIITGADTESAALTENFNNLSIVCRGAGEIQFTGATDGFDITGGTNFSISPGCILDHNSQSGAGTGPLINMSASTGLTLDGVIFQNVGVTSPNTGTIYINGTASQVRFLHLQFLGTQTDTAILVKSASTNTIADLLYDDIFVANCTLTTASSYCFNMQDSTSNFIKNVRATNVRGYFTGSTETFWGQNFVVQNTGEGTDEPVILDNFIVNSTGATTDFLKAFGAHHEIISHMDFKSGGAMSNMIHIGDTYFSEIHDNVMNANGNSMNACIESADHGRVDVHDNNCDGVNGGNFGIDITQTSAASVVGSDDKIHDNIVTIKSGGTGTCFRLVNNNTSISSADNEFYDNKCKGTGAASQNGLTIGGTASATITNTRVGSNFWVGLGGTGITVSGTGTQSNTMIAPQVFDAVTTPYSDSGTGTDFQNRIYTGSVTLAAGAGTFTLPAGSAGSATANWSCDARDITTATNIPTCTPSSATAATIAGTGTDVIKVTAYVH